MAITNDLILEALGRVNDPELRQDLVTLGMVRHVAVEGDKVHLTIELTTPACPLKDAIRREVERELTRLDGVRHVDIKWSATGASSAAAAHAGPRPQERGHWPGTSVPDSVPLPGVRNSIAIGAGKGGVGKSTIAVLAAFGLRCQGAKVGLLDADVYGPSIPKMLGIEGRQPGVVGDKLTPIDAHGLRVMSMGLLLEPDKAVIWRGPMVHGAVRQFLEQVDWGELDYLLIDLPPGTGDVPLTLSQTIPMTGAVVVCTPQEVALLDALRALRMYQQLNVDILGIVENMSYFIAPDTGREYDLFGRGGAKKAAEQVGVPFLGEIPINIDIRISGDNGDPAAIFAKTDAATRAAINTFVRNLAAQVRAKKATRLGGPLELRIT